MNTPTLALTGANLVTLDPEHPSGDTLLIQDDRIAAVGRAADLEREIAAAPRRWISPGGPCSRDSSTPMCM